MVVLRLPSLCASLLALLVMATAGSGTASAQFTSTAIWSKIQVVAPPAAPITYRYTIQGTFTGTYPAGNKAIGANCMMFTQTAGVWVTVPGLTIAQCGGSVNPAGGIYVYPTSQVSITKPPVGGDEYRFDVSWRYIPVIGLPGLFATTSSAVTTVMP